MREWATKMGIYVADKSKHVFPKMGALPNSNLTPILFPSPCNNYLNQFLAKINDWVSKTRKVVDSLMGFSLDIWNFPIGPRFEYSPPYPYEIMPPSL